MSVVICAVEHCAALVAEHWPEAERLLRRHAATLRLAASRHVPPSLAELGVVTDGKAVEDGRERPSRPQASSAGQRVPEPSVAERELREVEIANATAPADAALIREWGRANGVEHDRFEGFDAYVAAVNARRRELGLPPFQLQRHPLGALPPRVLRVMRKAGEATA